jgi:hypothetical protein
VGAFMSYAKCFISWGGVRLSPLGMSATIGLLCQPWMIDDDAGAAVE